MSWLWSDGGDIAESGYSATMREWYHRFAEVMVRGASCVRHTTSLTSLSKQSGRNPDEILFPRIAGFGCLSTQTPRPVGSVRTSTAILAHSFRKMIYHDLTCHS